MKLLPESPVEFLEPLSKPPESVYAAEAKGPFGSAVVAGTSEGVIFTQWNVTCDRFSHDIYKKWGIHTTIDNAPLRDIIERLTAYFHGIPDPIEVTVQPLIVTPFTLRVHRYLTMIPFGQTQTYGEIAVAMGKPGASRAVGGACGRNRTLIIVPCHRVLAAHGLGGFGAGLELKRKLLIHEGIKS
jgi:O-6-methylguanine DNA methyltransferase